MTLSMKYEKWGEFWLKNNDNWATQVQVMPFWTNMYLSWPHICIAHFQLCQMYYKANPVYLMLSWNKSAPLLTLNHYYQLKCIRNQLSIDNYRSPILFYLPYLIVIYFALIYSLYQI